MGERFSLPHLFLFAMYRDNIVEKYRLIYTNLNKNNKRFQSKEPWMRRLIREEAIIHMIRYYGGK
jgi:hypothetical protein